MRSYGFRERNNLKALALASGGKDSILALHMAVNRSVKLEGILTILPEDPESMLYHTQNVEHVERIAESIGTRWISVHASKDAEETALSQILSSLDIKMLITGGIKSKYQRDKFDNICKELSISLYSPLWGLEAREIYFLINKFKIDPIIISVASLGLGKEWLGQHLNPRNVSKLFALSEKYQFDPTGEGGDFETFVLNGLMYRKGLIVERDHVRWHGDRGTMSLDKVTLKEKEGVENA